MAVSFKVVTIFPETAGWQNWKSLGHISQEHHCLFFRCKLSGGAGAAGGGVSPLLLVVNTKALDHVSVLSY